MSVFSAHPLACGLSSAAPIDVSYHTQMRGPEHVSGPSARQIAYRNQIRFAAQRPVYLNSGAAFNWSEVAFMVACHFLSVSL